METNAATRMPLAPENDGFVQCWNEILTPKWIRFRHLLSGNGKIHSDMAYPRLGIRRGHRVLDVASGFGESSLELARQVGPEGSVLGLDCTEQFVSIAEDERGSAGVDNVEYRLGDIEAYALPEGEFDVAVSRFGMMYCSSPVRGMRAIARSLRAGGSVGLITWRALRHNPCWGVAEEVVLEHLPRPGDEAESCGPGPFSMAGEETNALILEAAGFVEVSQTRMAADICVGRTLEEALDYQLSVGPGGFVIREAGDRGQQALPEIRAALARRFAEFTREDGSVWLPSETLFIQARTPAS